MCFEEEKETLLLVLRGIFFYSCVELLNLFIFFRIKTGKFNVFWSSGSSVPSGFTVPSGSPVTSGLSVPSGSSVSGSPVPSGLSGSSVSSI